MRKAVVDVGSNSVLLLVEERSETGWHPVDERTWVTSLGLRTKETGLLSEESMRQTLVALEEAFRLAREDDASETIAAATMAARIASNTPEFLERASRQGTPVTVLSGEDEARLGFEAVANDPHYRDCERITIVDVGGQSTELMTAEKEAGGWKTLYDRSHAIGTLALIGGTLRDECPDPGAVLRAVVEVDDAIGLCYLRDQCGTTVTLGATGTNLVSIKLGMSRWAPERVEGSWLGFGEISEAAGRMMKMTLEERRALVGIEPGREATLPAGALILERFLDAIGAEGCAVTVRGWRHALLERGA